MSPYGRASTLPAKFAFVATSDIPSAKPQTSVAEAISTEDILSTIFKVSSALVIP